MSNITAPARMSLSAAFASAPFQEAIHNAINDAGRERTFIASVISASTANPVIQECTPKSVLSTALTGESLKLCPSPQLGHYYFVPFESKVKDRNGKDILNERGYPIKEKVAQFQLGYKGYIQLALRSGEYKKINVLSVKQGELIRWDPLNEELEISLIEDEDEREAAETIGYYASFEYLNGFRKAMYWTKKKMERHALRYSKGYAAKKGYTFWEKDFDAMAYKTMLRQLISKWGIMSVDMQRAFEADADIVQDDQGNNSFPGGDLPEQPPVIILDEPVPAEDEIPVQEQAAPRTRTQPAQRQVTLDDL